MPGTVALIVAAGRGSRASAGPAAPPKQYAMLAGRPVLTWAIAAFRAHPDISQVRVVIHPDDQQRYDAATAGLAIALPIAGGEARQDSVRLGLEACAAEEPERVLIHDAARPFVS